jgi:hypothetical protein
MTEVGGNSIPTRHVPRRNARKRNGVTRIKFEYAWNLKRARGRSNKIELEELIDRIELNLKKFNLLCGYQISRAKGEMERN